MTSLHRSLILATLSAFLYATPALADEIQLKNGQKYAGSISREGDLMVIRTQDGKTITANPQDIASVTLDDALSPADAATAEWTRVALQIKNADDLKTIISLQQKFLEKFPDASQAGQVKSSLQVYQKLADNDGVKFRGRWIPRAQVDVMVRAWKQSAQPASDLYHQGQFKDALESAKEALAGDAANPDALAISGLAAFHLKDAPSSKTYFTSLISADPTSLLAENNLAVIAAVQKSPAEGLIHYSKALAINPENRLLLDNIEEALAGYLASGGSRSATPYLNLVDQFGPAERKMEARMARSENGGLVRWGASWIAHARLETFKLYIDKSTRETSAIDAQYENIKQVLAKIDSQLNIADEDIEEATRQLNAFNAQLAQNGKANTPLINSPRDAAYQNLVAAQLYKAAIQKQHDDFVAASKDYLADLAKARGVLNAGPGQSATGYSGKQQLMEPGDDQNPPAPAAVSDPPAIPKMPQPPLMITAAAPVQRPNYQQLLLPTPPPPVLHGHPSP